MRLSRLRRYWDEFGRRDPLWAILTEPGKEQNRWELEEFLRTGRAEVAAFVAYLDALGVRPGRARALEFGCGAGRVTHALAPHFDEVIGVDIAPSMIRRARELHGSNPGLRFVENASPRLSSIESSSVDFIYSRLVLQHMRPRFIRRYLAEFVRVLKPGGVLLFQLPSDEIPPVTGDGLKTLLPLRVIAWIRAVRRLTRFPRMEIHGLSRAEVERRLRDLGTTIVDVTNDVGHGANTAGYRYCVVKPAQRG